MTLSSGVTSNATHATVSTVPAGGYGVWRSDDGGGSWTNVLSAGSPATDLEIDPLNGTPYTLYAGIRDSAAGVQRSTDGGQTWQPLNAGNQLPQTVLDRTDWPELAVLPATNNKTTVYAVLGDCFHPHGRADGTPAAWCQPGVWRSKNGGDTFNNLWPILTEPPATPTDLGPISAYTAYTHALVIHPTDPDSIWFGGIILYPGTVQGQTIDWTWDPDPGTYPAATGTHPDVHAMHVWEGDCSWAIGNMAGCVPNQCAYLLTDGGLSVGDGVNCWNSGIQEGLEAMQFQSVSADNTDQGPPTYVVGATQDNGTTGQGLGGVWHHWQHGDAGSTLIDRSGPPSSLLPVVHSVQEKLTPRRCSAPSECPQHLGTTFAAGIDPDQFVGWYPPMEQYLRPTANDLFFGAFHLWRRNWGSSWSDMLPPGLPIEVGPFPDINPDPTAQINTITAIGVTQWTADRMNIGYYDGTVFTSANATTATPTWNRIDDNGIGLPDRPVTAIAPHPFNPARAFVSLSGFGAHGVYVTDDAGASWQIYDANTDADDAFATRPVNALVVVPTTTEPPVMFAGTDEGVYRRATAELDAEEWAKSTSLPNAAVYDFALQQDPSLKYNVFAATHGRGVWRLRGTQFAFLELIPLLTSSSGFFSLPMSADGFAPFEACTLALIDVAGQNARRAPRTPTARRSAPIAGGTSWPRGPARTPIAASAGPAWTGPAPAASPPPSATSRRSASPAAR